MVICCCILADIPGAPTNLNVMDVTRDSVTLNWQRPRYDGGSKIKSYIVERCDSGRMIWTHAADVEAGKTTLTLPKLMEGTEYYFRVMAENEMGISDECRTEIPVKVKAPQSEAPMPPLGLRHLAMRRGSVTLAWDAPGLRQAQGMKGYLVQRRDEVSDWTDVATLPASTTRWVS